MTLSPPTRIEAEVYAAAQVAAGTHDRSTAQQLTYWARIGRELERSVVSQAVVDDVLGGRVPYDAAGDFEQAVVRATWSEVLNGAAGGIDLRSELLAARRSWSELDEHGHVVQRHPEA